MRDERVWSPRRKKAARRASNRRQALLGETLEPRLALTQTTGLFHNDPGTSDGYVLFSPNTSSSTYLIDKSGSVVHQWQSAYTPGLMGYLLPDGSLIRDAAPHGQGGNGSIKAAGAGGLLERFDWSGTKTWQFAYDSSTHLAHHDFAVLPNGNVLLVAWELKTATEATQAGRNPQLPGPGYLYPDSIVEVHPNLVSGGGDIVWEWHVWDHLVQQFDGTKNNWHGPTGVADHPELINVNYVSTGDVGGGAAQDWNHTNGIDYNPDLDQIVVSVREFSEVWIIDHSTTTAEAAGHTGGRSGHGGDLLYRWGNPQTYGHGTAADRVFYYQHDAKWIPDGLPGAGDITVFNNGFGRPGTNVSEADEFTPPMPDANGNYPLVSQSYAPSALTWHYVAPVADFSPIISGVQRLPNGDTLVTYGVDGTMVEVTAGGQEVWRYVNPYTGAGTLGPMDSIPSLGLSQPGLSALRTNFVFQAAQYPRSFVTQLPSTILGRYLFYQGSPRYDTTGTPQTPLPFSDDNAIAPDKSAYLPGSGATTFANVSSYTLGINGLMVDLAGTHGTIAASDFTFKTGNNNSPSTWTTVAAAATVTTRPGAGTGGSDRIEITFPNNAIQGTWLEVIVKGNDALGGNDTNTGLAASNVFFWANALADDGTTPDDIGAYWTTATDESDARNNHTTLLANIPITNIHDYNRDGKVNAIDQLASRNNATTNVSAPHILNISGAGPFAPDAGSTASPAEATASAPIVEGTTALPSGLSLAISLPSSVPPWLQGRLQNVLDSAPMVRVLHNLEQANTPASRQILLTIEQIGDKYNLHDDVLDGILVELGLE
jgi:hypothetical protein